jgi:hypothetical protein
MKFEFTGEGVGDFGKDVPIPIQFVIDEMGKFYDQLEIYEIKPMFIAPSQEGGIIFEFQKMINILLWTMIMMEISHF